MPRMPPLATYQRDLAGEALLTAWINGDTAATQTFTEWQMLHFSSTTDPDADAEADPDGDGQTNRMEFLQRTNPKFAQVSEWPVVTLASGNLELRFRHPAGRPGRIETSADLETWEVWNVPGNDLSTPLENEVRTFIAPRNETRRYFRLKLEEP